MKPYGTLQVASIITGIPWSSSQDLSLEYESRIYRMYVEKPIRLRALWITSQSKELKVFRMSRLMPLLNIECSMRLRGAYEACATRRW